MIHLFHMETYTPTHNYFQIYNMDLKTFLINSNKLQLWLNITSRKNFHDTIMSWVM